MIRITDSTLALLDDFKILPDQILSFCYLMKKIGIEDLEISPKVYRIIKVLPEGFRFYMSISAFENRNEYPGIHKFFYKHGESCNREICQLQLNDIREIKQLKIYKDFNHIRIIGLDDMLCHNYNLAMMNINEYSANSIINFCPENGSFCAVALAVQWILNGNSEITTSFAGLGNRAATEEVIFALRIAVRYKINQDYSALLELKKLIEEITDKKFYENKPVIGSELFDFEAGIHVDGIIKNPSNYLPFLPELVGQKFRVRIGKHSGSNSIKYKMNELGIQVENEKIIKSILIKTKLYGSKIKRGLSDEEFKSIVKEVLDNERKEIDS